jgi:NAD(P)-dependent dehydrogenase (short-subunit alcohol dehydrogenase family)
VTAPARRTALVTGGTGTLGGAVTRRFLEDGFGVAVTWRRQAERDALATELASFEDHLRFASADVTDADAVAAAVGEIGPVDVLAHLVGGWRGGERVASHSTETWEAMLRLNLFSAFVCARAVLPGMLERDWGRIVFVSSRTAIRGRSGQGGYAVAKSGLVVLAETIAEETRGTGVTANVVAPSIIDTPANRASLTSDPSTWVPAAAVAAAVAFLASEPAGQLRGAFLPLYGSA